MTKRPDAFTAAKLPYPVNRLYLNDVQREQVKEVYQKEQTYSEAFNATNQDKALKLLEPKLLWIKIWSSKWSTRDGEKQHTLYQWYELSPFTHPHWLMETLRAAGLVTTPTHDVELGHQMVTVKPGMMKNPQDVLLT